MSRVYNKTTLSILKEISQKPGSSAQKLYEQFGNGTAYKDFYNTIYRLLQQDLVVRQEDSDDFAVSITEDGLRLLSRFHPERDGIWKLVIFDIPEKQKHIRTILRAKLKSLHFKKWQNSIWVSPYALDGEIEAELKALSKKFFVRLIKTTDINNTEDLEKLFTD